MQLLSKPPVSNKLTLNVPYYRTRNILGNYASNLSVCAMAVDYLYPGISNFEAHLREKILNQGDPGDQSVISKVLANFGISSKFSQNLTCSDLTRSLLQKRPTAIRLLHHGVASDPKESHMVLVVGQSEDGFICHDPLASFITKPSRTTSDWDGSYACLSYSTLDYHWLTQGDFSGWGRLFTE
jgi:hypothetical protein